MWRIVMERREDLNDTEVEGEAERNRKGGQCMITKKGKEG